MYSNRSLPADELSSGSEASYRFAGFGVLAARVSDFSLRVVFVAAILLAYCLFYVELDYTWGRMPVPAQRIQQVGYRAWSHGINAT